MMFHKNGLFFAVNAVVVLLLISAIAPTPVSAQSDTAARVAIQGSDEFGDVLLIKDGDDIIIQGLAGAVSTSGEVTISADGVDPITVNASFVGHFPVKDQSPVRITGGAGLDSAQITFVKAGSGESVSGTINLDITGDSVRQALIDYAAEVDAVLKGEKTSIDKGMPPHILLDVVPEVAANDTAVGQVLLTQRLVIQTSGDTVNLSLVDQIEGISGASVTPPIQSFPAFAKVEVYGVPTDVNNPDIRLRTHVIDTLSFVDGEFVSNGYFFPFSIPNVNSENVDAIKASQGAFGIITPQVSDIYYLRIVQDDGTAFLATIANDITAGVQDNVTVTNNNSANAVGATAIATLQGTADPYAIVTAYAENDTTSEWIASAAADAAGQFTITIPPNTAFDAEKNTFGVYTDRSTVFLGASDPFGNISDSLVQVTTDDTVVVTETPIATPQADGSMIVAGKTEAGAIVIVDGRPKDGSQFFFAGNATADADGAYAITADPYFEYQVTIVDQAGNTAVTTTAGDQTADAPSNLTAVPNVLVIQVSGSAEPFSSIISFGFNAGSEPANPVESDTLPTGAFFLGGANLEFPETTAKAGADGVFTLTVPSSVGSVIYLQAIDPAGNGSTYVPLALVDVEGKPIGDAIVSFDSISVVNNLGGIPDVLNARTINPVDGAPVTDLVVAAFSGMVTDPNVPIPFVDQLSDLTPVNADGTFSLNIPDRSPETDDFVENLYLVAFTVNNDGTLRDVGFMLITESVGFDRTGPQILFAPLTSDVVLFEKGKGSPDRMNIGRIFPAGTGAGTADLPSDALPWIFIISDGGDDSDIDIHDPNVYVIDRKPLEASANGFGLPQPGVLGLDLGDNHWDAVSQKVVGESVVFIALMDTLGNLSPNPIPIFLDVEIQDPVASLISASGTAIFADEGAVEANSTVSVFANSDKSELIATTTAYENGGFAIADVSITQDAVYVIATDAAGNQSNLVKVKVTSPVRGQDFVIVDNFGIVHTSSTTLASAGDNARSVDKVGDTVYVLLADGTITKAAGPGKLPAESDLFLSSAGFARDIEVVSEDPFAAYVLMGNGLVITYGDLPFHGDLGTPDPSIPRLDLGDGSGRQFLDLNGNGIRDTEDVDGNGILDISVGIGGVLETEDTGVEGIQGSEGNGILDEEPILDLQKSDVGFGFDIARDLELVQDDAGTVKGYVILDGLGVLWAFGSDIDADNVKPNVTNGYAASDSFRSLELIVQDGKIVDFITMNGNGNLFGLPSDQGGVLGAGPSNDATIAGFLSADAYGLQAFGFDIARDIEPNPVDSNGDGSIDWQDGFYVLDGFGGLHAVGGAPEIEGAPFLGLDIAEGLTF